MVLAVIMIQLSPQISPINNSSGLACRSGWVKCTCATRFNHI